MIYVCTTYGLFVFFPSVFLSSRVAGACPVTTDLIMRVDVRPTTTIKLSSLCIKGLSPQTENLALKHRFVFRGPGRASSGYKMETYDHPGARLQFKVAAGRGNRGFTVRLHDMKPEQA